MELVAVPFWSPDYVGARGKGTGCWGEGGGEEKKSWLSAKCESWLSLVEPKLLLLLLSVTAFTSTIITGDQ